ncbi:ferric reductase like transmembrane component-domain-containing protein [Lineolata rhizophorae]|uniref:Ferric reductase like transmembrane component-domain-containing protein n=1 Tax=Lineolata rhizophorae TaxID=578093 RepID=A0A6A6NVW1_9PEZI|nr:ferric reductase like transmembrane component-domain-containing protein [Lineolata rhizophorae]
MGFLGYAFVNLDEEGKIARRVQLDHHANVALWTPLVLLLLCRVVVVARRLSTGAFASEYGPAGRMSPLPRARLAREFEVGSSGAGGNWKQRMAKTMRLAQWWADDDVMSGGWGTRGEWINVSDYLHLTKRFGIIAASQLPFHYLLSLKPRFNPIQLLTGLSHEQLNPFHRLLGRLIIMLLLLHASFYLNFFVRASLLTKRTRDFDVIFGVLSLLLLITLGTTSLAYIRERSYSIFYTLHISGSLVLLATLSQHTAHLRAYVLTALGLHAAFTYLREAHALTLPATLTLLPHTRLIRVRLTLPPAHPARRWRPASHVYVHRPTAAAAGAADGSLGATAALTRFLRSNPFTVASLPDRDGELLLVARARCGATRALAEAAAAAGAAGDGAEALRAGEQDVVPEGVTPRREVALRVHGPYGAARWMAPKWWADFERVLLIAGGIGGTFTVPVWREIVECEAGCAGSTRRTKVRMVWAVKKPAEAGWVGWSDGEDGRQEIGGEGDDGQGGDRVELYLTGSGDRVTGDESMELEERQDLLEDDENIGRLSNDTALGAVIKTGRPRLRQIVDETFSGHGGKVAVLVCGPDDMVKSLRREVGRWVWQGADLFWHAEAFGL